MKVNPGDPQLNYWEINAILILSLRKITTVSLMMENLELSLRHPSLEVMPEPLNSQQTNPMIVLLWNCRGFSDE